MEEKWNNIPTEKISNCVSSSVEQLHLKALDGNDGTQTGQFILTLKPGAGDDALNLFKSQGLRTADARDFKNQAATPEEAGDADCFFLPEIGVAFISGDAAKTRNMGMQKEISADNPIESIDPEYFVFAENNLIELEQGNLRANLTPNLDNHDYSTYQATNQYLRGFIQAAKIISQDLQANRHSPKKIEEDMQALGETWGLKVCKVPPSLFGGRGIKVAVLGTGFDFGHPDFVGRTIVSRTFVGEPVQDFNGHATHMTGTACGPKAPAGNIPRYGIGYRTSIFVGKVLSNSGVGTQAGVLAGMNWAIANRCPVIFAALGSATGPQPAYTAAGQAALNNGCLIIAGSSGSGSVVGAPANSPTIISAAAVGARLSPASFSPTGKIDFAAPGVNIFSSYPRPRLYMTFSGIASAAAHIAGCAALWAEKSPSLRGLALWRKLQASARRLPFLPSRVGAGLVQAP